MVYIESVNANHGWVGARGLDGADDGGLGVALLAEVNQGIEHPGQGWGEQPSPQGEVVLANIEAASMELVHSSIVAIKAGSVKDKKEV